MTTIRGITQGITFRESGIAMKRVILATVSLAIMFAGGVAEAQVRTMFPTTPPKTLARAPGGVVVGSPFPALYPARDTSPGVRNNFRGVAPIPRASALPVAPVLTAPDAVAPAPSPVIVTVPVPMETAADSIAEVLPADSLGYSTPVLPKPPIVVPSPAAAEQPGGDDAPIAVETAPSGAASASAAP
jgi:hypothetical protein